MQCCWHILQAEGRMGDGWLLRLVYKVVHYSLNWCFYFFLRCIQFVHHFMHATMYPFGVIHFGGKHLFFRLRLYILCVCVLNGSYWKWQWRLMKRDQVVWYCQADLTFSFFSFKVLQLHTTDRPKRPKALGSTLCCWTFFLLVVLSLLPFSMKELHLQCQCGTLHSLGAVLVRAMAFLLATFAASPISFSELLLMIIAVY